MKLFKSIVVVAVVLAVLPRFATAQQWTMNSAAIATGTSSAIMLPPTPVAPPAAKTAAASTNAVTNSPPPSALVSATVAQNSQRALMVYSTAWWTNKNYTNIEGKVGPAIVPLNYFTVITNVSIAGLSAYIAEATNPAGPFTMAFVAPYTASLTQISFTDSNAAPKKFYRAGYFYADPTP